MNRSDFLKLIELNGTERILEIGPLNRPLVTTHNAKYFDLFSTEDLKNKAILEGLEPSSVPDITWSDSNGNLDVITESFSNIVSAHCIEHQPDFIKHLKNVSKILSDSDSRYWLVIPDKRYCFDALIPESSLIEIIAAYEEHVTRPSIWKVIEHRAFTTHNDPILHWQGNHGAPFEDIKVRFDAAKLEYENAQGRYIDVHCWQFTPESFSNIIGALFNLGITDFQVEKVWETHENDLEFFIALKKVSRVK